MSKALRNGNFYTPTRSTCWLITVCSTSDSPSRALTGGDERLMFNLRRSLCAGTAIEAHLFVAVLDDQKIVGSASFFGPGLEVCGRCVPRVDVN